MDHNHLTIKTFMAIMAERDAAIRERNMALEERKRAFAERDMAMLQRDAALSERNSAIHERDEAIATLRFRGSSMNDNNMASPELPGNVVGRGVKRSFSDLQMHHMFELPEDNYDQRETPINETYEITDIPSETTKPRKVRQSKKAQSVSSKHAKSPRGGRKAAESVKIEQDLGADEDSDALAWKDNLGLNQVNFDESAMPVPVCSCTGVPQPCYKWGNGGWQSACCTTTMSMYPLPQVSNKRYSRVGGRKMSGGAFTKLLSRLAAEGYDLSNPLDLKEHWAKHGTNRYSTLK